MNLAELASLLGAARVGPADLPVGGVGALDDCGPDQVVVAFDADALAVAEAGPAAAVVVGAGLEFAKPHLIVANPRQAFERLLELFSPPPPPLEGIHPRAILDPSAVVGPEPSIGPNVVIGPRAVIGARCRIGANTVIDEDVHLGDDVTLHPHVLLRARVTVGCRVVIHAGAVIGAAGFGYRPTPQGHQRVPHLGTVVIGDDVEIGANAVIDRAKVGATRIGAGCKLDSLVLVGHNCRLGEGCLLVGQVGLAGSVKLGRGVVVAGQAGVADHLHIGDGAMIGGQAGVMKSVEPGDHVVGTPAVNEVEFFRQVAALRRLRQLGRRVDALEERLGRTPEHDV